MINIITEGKSRFKATCERCLCVFEYDISDLVKYISCEYVRCPCCKNDVLHRPNIDEAVGDCDDQPYFTPQEVRAMSSEEVRKNYSAIMESMKRWNEQE